MGTTTSFTNTPQATDDIFKYSEDAGIVILNVMANDLGGNAKTLFSIDDGVTTSNTVSPMDLLTADIIGAQERSLMGAKISITADGKVSYDLTSVAAFQALAAGETAQDSFIYAIRLGNGTLSWAKAIIQVAGANDAVSITSIAQTGLVSEDSTTAHAATGTISFTDVDLSDAHAATFAAATKNTTALGTFVLAAVSEAPNAANGSVGWAYTLDDSKAQYLAAGETVTETYTVKVDDGHGSATTQDVVITITGTNDKVSITSGAQGGSVNEDAPAAHTATGTIAFTDADLRDGHTASVTASPSSALGTFALAAVSEMANAANGSVGWTYTVDDSKAQYLAAGQQVTETYTVTVDDGHGSTTTQNVVITITGTNDAATITASTSEDTTVTEAGGTAGDALAGGRLTVHDVDTGENHFAAPASLAGTYGNFSFNADTGAWTYTLDQSKADALTEGQKVTETLTVASADGTASQKITVNIVGANDAAIISGTSTGTVAEVGNNAPGTATATGTLTDTDVDNAANAFTLVAAGTQSTGGYGTYQMTAGGVWTYTLDNSNAAVQGLNTGDTLQDTFTVTTVDGTQQTITVTINGANDAAIISGTSTGAVAEVGNNAPGMATATGTLTDTDVDNVANSFTAVTTDTRSAGGYGTYQMTAGGVWTYTLDNSNAAVQGLNTGDTLQDTFTVTTVDGTQQTITVTINGANDAAIISGTSTGSVAEVGNNAPGAATATGTLTDTDVDNVANSFTAVTTDTRSAGGYGTYQMTAGGVWTYTLDNSNAAVQGLNTGDTLQDTFTVTTVDGTQQTITVTINGANDAAIISGISTGSVAEVGNNAPGMATATGTLTDTDVDNAANTFTDVAAGTQSIGGYGTYQMTAGGVWTYTLDNSNAAVQGLNTGDTLTDTFTVTTVDGTQQTITVTINGANDAAIISGTSTGSVAEVGNNAPGTATATGTLTDTDVDNAANTFTDVTTDTRSAGGYGTYQMTAGGVWTYTLDNSNATVQGLNTGDTLTDTFTVTTVDGTQQTITVTINGANDAAIISGISTGAVAEVGNNAPGMATATGTLTDTDVDNAANTFTDVAAGTQSTGGYGTYQMTAGGVWTYTLDNSNAAVQGLNTGDTLTDTFTVTTVDGTQQTITVTINGANDAAIISGASTGAVAEVGNNAPGMATATGTLTDTDVDNAANTFTAVTTDTRSAGGYGTYQMTAGGVWTYTLDNGNAAVQGLNTGDTLTDTFTVTTVDGTQQTITVTINGANDAAIISGASTGSVAEVGNNAPGMATATGTLTDTDVDNAANTFTDVTTDTRSAGGYGTYQMTAGGVWTYTLDNSNAAVQGLNTGDTLTDTFTVTTVDGTQQTITVTINGANDAAIISGASTGSVAEVGNNAPGTATATGTLTDTDVDNAANTFTDVTTDTRSAGGYGTYQMTAGGVWTYTLDNSNAAVQGLNTGDTLTDTFTVTTVDGTQQTITVTINGANDAAIISGASTGSVAEVGNNAPGAATATGTLTDTDVDNVANSFTAVTTDTRSAGGYGTYQMTAGGVWTYTLDNGNAAVQGLNTGDTLTDTFTVTTVDGTQQTITVTINGANDAAIISGISTGAVAEVGNNAPGTATATGTLTDTDVDNAANTFTAVTTDTRSAGGYGTYQMTAGGVWTYTLDNSNAAVQGLNTGGTLQDTFTVTTVDGTQQTITVTINGANDAAIISGASTGAVAEAGNNVPGTPTVTGTLTDTDVDNAANTFTDVAAGTQSIGGYGTYQMTAGGVWTYTLDNGNAAVQGLNTGDTLQDTFTVTTVDGTQQTITVTINGANDAAIISGTKTGAVAEAGTNVPGTPTATGTLTDTDVDNAANTFTDVAAGTQSIGGYGTYQMTAGGVWTYTLDNGNTAVQGLNTGDTLTDTFTVTTVDGTQQTITVTINGANDAAIISGISTGSVAEVGNNAPGMATATGTLTDTDVDNAANAFTDVAAGTQSIGGYGTYQMTAGGVWTYTLDNSNAAVQGLNTGDTLTDTFTVTTVDGTQQTITVTINGANDAAIISGTSTGSVAEVGNNAPGTATATGTLTDTDVDNAANTFTDVTTDTRSAGGYGTYQMTAGGVWTYTLDNSNAAVQGLNTGDTLTDTFTVTTVDGTQQTITVTINGANDAAIISGTKAGAVAEVGNNAPGMATATGTLTDTDVDNAANTFTDVAAGTQSTGGYGTYQMTAAGIWTYTLDNSNAAVQGLNTGDTLTDTFTVTTVDGTQQTITVTINGANDAAIISGASTGAVAEVGNNAPGMATATGTLTDTDVDNAANTFTAVTTDTRSAGGYGTYQMTAGGVWTYTLDNGNAAVQGLNTGDTLTDTFTVTTVDGTQQTITVTINGANDAAIISGASTGSVAEVGNNAPGTATATGTLTDTDVDNAANTFTDVTTDTRSAGGYGTYQMTAGGVWTYTLDNSNAAVQGLNTGDTLTDTFTVTTVDGTQQTITVTINGANDAAIISGTKAGAVAEVGNNAPGMATATGTLTDTDVDNAANTFTDVAAGTQSTGGYGTYQMTAAGIWTYTLDNSNAAVQGLNTGDTLTDTFTVTTVDGTQQTITVTINGANDAAIISGASTGSVAEVGNNAPGMATATGTLTDTDVDNAANTFTAVTTDTRSAGGYGTYQMTAGGVWTYTLDNSNAAVQGLNTGDTLTDTFTVTTVDGTQQTITVTINGANDAAIISGASTGSVAEVGNNAPGAATATGTLTDTDVDNVANSFTAVTTDTRSAGGYGTYQMTAGGVWTYTLDNGNAAVQGLNTGDTLTDTFTVTTVDGTQQTITVTINGANDAAIISGISTGAVAEVGNNAPGTATATGTLTDTDVDNAANTFTAVTTDTRSAGGYGTYQMTAGGVWTYTLDNSNAAVQGLNTGGTLQDTFTVTTVDGTQQTITVTINGANDAAIISGASTGAVAEAGNNVPGTPTVTGTLTDTDVDNAANTFTDVAAGTQSIGGYGTYQMTAGGVWTYTLDNGNAAVQGLNTGGTLQDTFTVTTVDGTQQTITVTINGANDAAIISGASTGAVAEAGNNVPGTPTATGTLTDTDVDNAANTFTDVAAGTQSIGGYGTYQMTAGGVWTYTLDNSNAAVQGLNTGDTLTDTFTVTTVDGTQQTITVTINGANDAAIISGASTGAVAEAGNNVPGTPTATGTLTDTDVDNVANSFTAVTTDTRSAGGYGTYQMTAAGVWTYTLDNGNAAVQGLNTGDTLTDTFTVTTVDGTQQTITVTINGANDAAIISGISTGAVAEVGNNAPGTATATGTLTDTDVDNAANTFTDVAAGTQSIGGYGTYQMTAGGVWTYTLDNSNAAVQGLNTGDTLTDTFTVTTVDGTQQTITVTINGANDAAIISGISTGAVAEVGNNAPGTATATGTLTSTDVDNAANTFTDVAAGTQSIGGYGTYQMTAGGVWTYTLDNSNAAVQGLNTGDTLQDTFTVTTVDGTQQTITVTINGANDAAIISGISTGAVAEVGNNAPGMATATGTLTDTDVDNAANTFTAVTTDTRSAGGYGTYQMTAGGVWTYTLDNSNAAVQGLNTGDTLTDTFTVTTVDGTQQTITVTINGANDAAIISGTKTGAVAEAGTNVPGTPTATGTLTDTDVDNAANTFTDVAAGTQSTGGYGTYQMTAGGVWTYTLDNGNAAVQGLNTGDTLQDTFTVTTVDGTQQTITVTINGANDAAIISGASTGSVAEVGNNAPGTATATGTLTDTDVDNAANTFTDVAAGTQSTGGYGTYQMTAGGVWTYTLDNSNAAVQGLNTGDTLQDTFTVTTVDGTQQTITVTINGANDAAIISGISTGTVAEVGNNAPGAATATGTLTDTDVDNAANTFTAVTTDTRSAGGYGTYQMTAGGVWTYTLDNSNAAVQGLNTGDTLQDTFTVTTVDGTQQTITVTINGANDAAIISGTSTGSVAEVGNNAPGTATATGTLTDTDVDNAANTFTDVAAGTQSTGGYGTYQMTAGGVWTYTLDNSNAAVQGLNTGDTLTDTFTVTTVDGTQQTITVTINGANDAAIISGISTGTVAEVGNNAPGAATATGTLTDTDVDNAANTFTDVAAGTQSIGGYGTYQMTAGGVWTYTLDNGNAAVQGLNTGDTLQDTFTVTTVDGTQQTITVTINGANDAAIISGISTGTVAEVGNNAPGTATATGTLTDTDVDNAANTFTLVAAGTQSTGGYGTYQMTAGGVWTYTLDNSNAAVQGLNTGDTLQDTFTVTTVDGTQQTITVTINGANDAAIISGISTGAVAEVGNNAPGMATATGTLTDTDVDNAANTFTDVAAGTQSTGGYGTYQMTAGGVWTYTLDNSNAAVQALNTNGTLQDTFTVTTVDGTQQTITVTINGANDAAIISGTSTGSVAEVGNNAPGMATATGTLTDTDVDNAANTFTAVTTDTRSAGGYGTYQMTAGGVWTYTLDNSNAAVQALNTGGTLNDTFTVTTVDGTQQTITVTINGANDAAIISGTKTGAVAEAGTNVPGTPTATGTLTDTDVDNAANAFTLVAAGTQSTGGYGTYQMTTGGVWTYTLDNNNAAVQGLNTGGTLNDTFTVTTVDGTQQTITVTINGANDAAIISGTKTGAVAEAGTNVPGTPTATGTLTDTDVDNAANAFTLVAAGTQSTGGYGTYQMTTGGVWTYTLDNNNAAVQGLNTGGTLNDTFTVTTVDGTQQTITVTINGANDAAIISGTKTGAVAEAGTNVPGTPTATGTLTDTDVDNAANAFTLVAAGTQSTGGYGTYQMTTGGVWTYTLDNNNAAVQGLNTGGTLNDTFTVTTVDGTQQTITVTINGANDAAIISGTKTGAVAEAGTNVPGTPTATGTLTDTDVDNAANAFTLVAAGTQSTGGYGTYQMTTGGVWTYTLDNNNAAVQGLNTGGTLNDTFTVTTVDGTQQTITVTINGANDAAIISGTKTGAVAEAGTNVPGTATATGTLTDTDVDNAANAFTLVAAGTQSTGGYGTYQMTAGGVWTYTLDNSNAAVQGLNTGGTLNDTFTVTTVDGTQQTITVTINGANDAAIISGTKTGAVAEAGTNVSGTPTATGTLTDTDVDNAANAFTLVAAGTQSTGGYGTYQMTAAGVWTYTLDNSNAAVQALNTGGTLNDTFTVTTVDGTQQTITVTINGANDAAIISGTKTGAVAEAGTNAPGTATATGTLTDTDVDNAANAFTLVAAGTQSTGGYGTYQMTAGGVWTYTLDNSNAAVQALNTGGTLNDTFTVTTVDGTQQTITVTINGANDAAIISGTKTGAVAEAGTNVPGTATATGTLTDTDVDNAANAFTLVAAGTQSTGGYGTYQMTAGGVWTYTLDNSNAAVQGLNTGGTLNDTFTVTTVDGTQQTITVTINGANDAAIISGTKTGAVAEAGTNVPGTPTATGTLTDTDVDNAANAFTLVAAGTQSTGGYGTYQMTAGGVWTYTLDNSNAAVQALNTGATLHDTFTVTTVDGTQQTITVTINGTNDAPTLSDTIDPAPVTELANASAQNLASISGSFAVSDLDVGDTLTASVVGSPTVLLNGNAFTLPVSAAALTANGAFAVTGATSNGGSTSIGYTYDPSAANLDFLRAGQSLTITYQVKVNDGTADSATQDVKFTINGTNDAPTLSDTIDPAPVTELANASAQNLALISGSFAVSDLDVGDTLTASVVGSPTVLLNGNAFTLPVSAAALTANGAFAVTGATSNGGSTSIGYTYDPSAANLDFLRAGQSLTITYQVKVNDGTADSATQDVKFTITGTNDAPSGTDKTITINSGESYTLLAADFGFADLIDSPADTLKAVKITSLPSAGTLTLSGTAVVAGQMINATDLPNLVFKPATGGSGTNYSNFTFQVQDTGGTANGGVDLDQSPNIMTFNVAAPSATATMSTNSVSGNKVKVDITFSKDVQFGTLDATDFQFVYKDANGVEQTLTPTNFSSTQIVNSKKITVEFNAFTGTDTANGTLTLKAGTYSFTDGSTGVESTLNSFNMYPAGTAGEPINLALTTPSDAFGKLITVTIGGMPSDWTLNAGSKNADGTWTVTTNDVSSLAVTTPSGFSGAVVLNINETWTATDGTVDTASTTSTVSVANNVEAYAPGNPIFAVSTDDNLTGSSAADLFVFAQPIAHNTVFNFDTAADKIDLIGFAGINGFSDLSIADDANGNAVVTLATGATITVVGVHAASLTTSNFAFNVEPVSTNTGTLTIADGAIMPFGGVLNNSGTIELNSAGSDTQLEVLVESLKLQGGGRVTLSDNEHNAISGGAASAKLVNIDNTISGAGQIGAGQMTLDNRGVILADGSHALTIDTGANTVSNSGTLEATGAGGLVVNSALENSGKLWANGGNLTVHGDVSGSGNAVITGAAVLELDGVANVAVNFDAGSSGALKLGDADHFSGSIAGFGGNDSLRLADIAVNAGSTLSFVADASGGTLTVGDGTSTAHLALLGSYANAGFVASADQGGGMLLTANVADVNQNLHGTGGIDLLASGAGNDVLAGGAGNDVLFGGAGNDTFVFDTALNGNSNVDTILDFRANGDDDHILLSQAVFGSLTGTGGTLDASQFASVSDGSGGSALLDAGVHLIYDSQTGSLYYDADGANTTGGRTLVAVIGTFEHPSGTVVTHDAFKFG